MGYVMVILGYVMVTYVMVNPHICHGEKSFTDEILLVPDIMESMQML